MEENKNSRLCFSQNIKLLRQKNSSLSELLENNIAPSISIMETKTKNLTISVDGILLHSKYNPLKEAENFTTVNDIKSGDKILLYGFGLGYHIIPILEKIGKEGKLVIIECNLNILETAFSLMDLTALFTYSNWSIISAKTEMDMAVSLEETLSESFNDVAGLNKKILLHPPSFKCIPNNFPKIKNAIEMLSVGKDTAFVFKDLMIENLKENLDTFLSAPGITSLFGAFKDMPAFLVGAGPSLDQALPFLFKNQKNAFICAVDTVFPVLCEHGIQPDMVFSVDPQPESFVHFDKNTDNTAILVFSPVSAKEIVRKYQGPKIAFLKKDQKLLEPVINDLAHKGLTIGGGSVSCIALDILASFAPSDIILIGMDFGFPQGKAYSRHAREIKNITAKTEKFLTPEMIHRQIIRKKKIIYLDGKNSSKVATHQNMHSYVKNIEQIIRLHPQINYINFCSNGVKIKGTKYIYFEEETNQYLQNDINKSVLKKAQKLAEIDVDIKEKIIANIILKK